MGLISIFDLEELAVRVAHISTVNRHGSQKAVVCGHDMTPLALGRDLSKTFRCRSVGDRESQFALALRGLGEHPAEPCAGSSGSAATYWLVEPLIDSSLLLIQYIPPHAETSIHYHQRETEFFFPLAGESFLHLGSSNTEDTGRAIREPSIPLSVRIEEGNVHAGVGVAPNRVHQIITRDQPALNVILITNTRAQHVRQLGHVAAAWDE